MSETNGIIRPARKVRTAFMVVVDETGKAVAIANMNEDVELDRPASLDDMARACREVVADIESSQTAQRVMQLVDQRSSQAQAAQQIRDLGPLRS